MATSYISILQPSPTPTFPRFRHLPLSANPSSLLLPFLLSRTPPLPLISSSRSWRRCRLRKRRVDAAYVSAPASDPDAVDKASGPLGPSVAQTSPLSWGVVWSLLSQHKRRIAISAAALVGCTSCTLAMPIYSGQFFEILIGRGKEPLWTLLSKIAVLYSLEPVFTVIYVINMTTIWEKVMVSLRGQIFRRMLIQKVEFYDRYKVGELTGLLTSDLGSLKGVVSENISRDRGLRALSEASYFPLLSMSA